MQHFKNAALQKCVQIQAIRQTTQNHTTQETKKLFGPERHRQSRAQKSNNRQKSNNISQTATMH